MYILNIKNIERIKNLVLPLLKKYLNNEYENHKNLLRRAISYVDKLLYSQEVTNF